MCGLVGVAGDITAKYEKAFLNLLEVDTRRGPHSTGVGFVRRYATVKPTEVVKCLGTPWDFYKEFNTRNLFSYNHSCLIGHNRWATKGAISAKNAHPFDFDGLIGAHNGTLLDQSLLMDSEKFEVDSENLYHHMNEKGVRDAIEKTHGAFALTWWDKNKNTINLLRNDQRTLFYTITKDEKTIFWASERWMLESQLALHKIEHKEIAMLPELTWVSIEISKLPGGKLGKVRMGKVTQYVPPKKSQSQGYQGGYFPGLQNRPPNYGNSSYSNSNQAYKGAGANGNVAEIRPKQSTAALTNMVGKTIELRPIAEKVEPASKQSYVLCRGVDYPLTLVRLYLQRGNPKYAELKLGQYGNYGNLRFEAKLKSVCIASEYYLADMRTLVAVEKKRSLYPVFGGVLVDKATFDDRVQEGCTWCTAPIFADEADDIAWGDDKSPFCVGCKENKEVIPFIR